ncbi:MAG: glycerol acyltransferase, partial [Gammaproteobacteria bacterium]|nr:glycerol acyltransferase [Gammaproteobacteria bacterium]
MHEAGYRTTRNAIGDNLLATGFAADVFRLNKGFIVQRNAKGAKVAYAAMLKTSQYIRHSLESGESVWIAQREGRAKDGWDRTDPAIIKMFALAYRKEVEDMGGVIARLGVLPVAISYELDPCDLMKARELETIARTGRYEKRAGEDLESVVTGIRGDKGRVQLHFGTPLTGAFDDASGVAAAIDRQIVAGYRLFPTHLWAAAESGMEGLPPHEPSRALAVLKARVDGADRALRPHLLLQYANPVRRARELGLIVAPDSSART